MNATAASKRARPRDAALTLVAYANARPDVIAGMVDPAGVLTHVVVEDRGGISFLDRRHFLTACRRPEHVWGTELTLGEAQFLLRAGGLE